MSSAEEYPSTLRTKKYFVAAAAFLVLQMVLGIVMSFQYLGRDLFVGTLPFDILKALHLNLMVLWLLLGFIGGLYYLLPSEVGRDIKHPWMIDFQFWFLLAVGVGIVLSELLYTGKSWWLVEGREYVEAGRLWDVLITVGLLTVVYTVGATVLDRKREMSSSMLVLTAGAVGAILMYVPGEIWFDSLVVAEYFRWWVVHYWVEATFELIAAGALGLILLKMTDVSRSVIEKYLALEVVLVLITGIIGQGHHYYWIGTPDFWFFMGGFFSALEPVPLFLMAWAGYRDFKENEKPVANRVALYMVFGAALGNLLGAGFWGFLQTLPQVNFWTHGTQVTASHAHFATPGTYLLLVLGIAYLAVPDLSGKPDFPQLRGKLGFWTLVLGFANMILALLAAGIVQVYAQRVHGATFMETQNIVLQFLGWRAIGGIITLAGALIIVYDLLVLSRGEGRAEAK